MLVHKNVNGTEVTLKVTHNRYVEKVLFTKVPTSSELSNVLHWIKFWSDWKFDEVCRLRQVPGKDRLYKMVQRSRRASDGWYYEDDE